ncbi:MAG: HAD family hydrolase [Bacteroidetes bacterium]|nr:MAG: HAD family hydrolase [Bacteroidota bacterium]
MEAIKSNTKHQCFHCGDVCNDVLNYDNHLFCCVGCKSVYQLLSDNKMCNYYDISVNPGVSLKHPVLAAKFAYLDDAYVVNKLLHFNSNTLAKVTFFIPSMHCSSCIWLLEHLYKLNPHIALTRVNFLKKELHIDYNPSNTTLREVVTLLASIGYEPSISLHNLGKTIKKDQQKRLSYQIGVAGFCFGNIMLLSFPEYFGLDQFTHGTFSTLFGYVNLLLSLPVFLYSAQDYFTAAWSSIKKHYISIDIPLALGILVMFGRSAYEVLTGNGIGWFDTHAGLVFFLLIGKWFQQKTFDTLLFERDYTSYFPIAVTVTRNNVEQTIPVTSLVIGDRMVIRNNELIPADAILFKGDARIDFSFVTGESEPVAKGLGEIVYAGGKQCGSTIELEVSKVVSQSYLTQLWNNEVFAKNRQSTLQTFQQTVSKYFTIALLLIAFGSGLFWLFKDATVALNAFTAVLIIACPCALALSSPFALGTAMRVLGRNKFYLKSTEVVEGMAQVNAMVFDKTGTLTQPYSSTIHYHGRELTVCQQQLVASTVAQSIHPLSQKIKQHLPQCRLMAVQHFQETAGKGIQATVNKHAVKIGSADFVNVEVLKNKSGLATRVYIDIDGEVKGFFEINQTYRQGLGGLLNQLQPTYGTYLLSGDNNKEKEAMLMYFKQEQHLLFNQAPADKLQFIQQLQANQNCVAMIGDGLNDAGALKAANIGISITENTSHFTPASDVIMDGERFHQLADFFKFSKNTMQVIHLSFVISLIYNIVGLSYAVQGNLSPIIAAILMPISSVTVIVFTTLSTTWMAKKRGLA